MIGIGARNFNTHGINRKKHAQYWRLLHKKGEKPVMTFAYCRIDRTFRYAGQYGTTAWPLLVIKPKILLKEYSISDIILSNPKDRFFYVGTFEGTEDPKVEWPHRHDFYSIVWFTKSTGINVIDFEEYEIKHNRLFLMRPKQVHNWSYSKSSNGYIVVFDRHLVKEITDFATQPFIDLSNKNTKLLTPLFENLIDESGKNDELGKKTIIHGISFLLLQLKRLSNENPQDKGIKSKGILRFSKLVSETIGENISVNEYASRLNLTVDNLNQICKENYGQSPKTIILEKKITEAKRLLYFTDLSVKEIAFRLGFEDSSYFSRIFKQKTNLSPTEFKST
ncbi:AraC family transcriptional regulator [Flagellimonas okinawensis]|uniref:AraC family transcriptional regulator n=1 Tax=Flagellimonas okinawensis TaxID=3031324 RepID=A0ABT5XP73_9FLAO|nr:AraC family transcriptional regulator [[Muricauda] okinawensis]MDF0707668.1 AraC family transcriptional regulator [[Muricauda] okinawensis]